ncbi:MAG: hypothetical protein ABSB24_18170 [Gaiellaceae bacterium]|jgi:hypothetical protein
MTRSRLPSLLLGALLVAAAAAAAIALNVLLLGRASAQNDPVGRLAPSTHVPAAPEWTVRPTTGRVEDRGADD